MKLRDGNDVRDLHEVHQNTLVTRQKLQAAGRKEKIMRTVVCGGIGAKLLESKSHFKDAHINKHPLF